MAPQYSHIIFIIFNDNVIIFLHSDVRFLVNEIIVVNLI